MKLIVNADDFGLSRAVNYGILDAMQIGIVSSTTMMMNMPGTSHAADLIDREGLTKVGVHLVLTSGRPLTNAKSLINDQGLFKLSNQFALEYENNFIIDPKEVENEWVQQIESFISLAGKPNHLDSHHHIHLFKPFQPIIKRISEKFDLPVRSGNQIGVSSYADYFEDGFYKHAVEEKYFHRIANKYGTENKTIEIMSHPAYIDNVLMEYSSYSDGRLNELSILMSKALKDSGWFLK
ncbi:Cellobiose phosphotransferase system YdjC-like protein [Salisediminibacterium beveridgei]|uniref:Cellobiose phosphotransferase system YdjC-like protein n=2 Tax=Salisediminibacterium beveridgei TaxID=632773 RepID=A0A1D7QZH9_9BACI|nr:Cellobiose phosphotransferase system YdjC-like protein [Salisediminibacterium beveridgei]